MFLAAAVAVAPAACAGNTTEGSVNTSQFTHFEGFCRDAFGDDVLANAFPAGAESLAACRAACSESSSCEGFEWYPDTPGYEGVKCHTFPGSPGSGGSSTLPIRQGGGSFLDAQCYIEHGCRDSYSLKDGLCSVNTSQFAHFEGFCRDAFGDDVLANAFPAGAIRQGGGSFLDAQ